MVAKASSTGLDHRREKKLFTLMPKVSTKGITECENMSDIDTCIRIDVKFGAMEGDLDLAQGENEIIFRHSYTEKNDDGTVTYSYESDDMDSALFLYTEVSGYQEIDGSFTEGESKYIIDNCGKDCHVLMKLSAKRLNPPPEPIKQIFLKGMDRKGKVC